MLAPLRLPAVTFCLAAGLVACDCGTSPSGGGDGGLDAGPGVDGGGADAGVDAGGPDAGAPDAGSPDAGAWDGGNCPPPPACDAPPPAPDPIAAWRHSIATPITVASGAPRHRGRDLYLTPGDAQWALAKFAYGALDDDLKDEDVDLYLLRDCASWERLGTATTTNDGAHATVEGVVDTGGWVYFSIPTARALGPGRHRVRFVVRGDHSTADQFLEVLPAAARFAVSDVDGTLTDDENAAFVALLTGSPPNANPGAAAALWALAGRGYHVFYLTARPEWLGAKTHEWLDLKGFPPGNVHTTLTATGALGAAAQAFKTDELAAHQARFPASVEYAFGNTASDFAAFSAAGVSPAKAYSFLFDPGAQGTRHTDYVTLVPGFRALPPVCP